MRHREPSGLHIAIAISLAFITPSYGCTCSPSYPYCVYDSGGYWCEDSGWESPYVGCGSHTGQSCTSDAPLPCTCTDSHWYCSYNGYCYTSSSFSAEYSDFMCQPGGCSSSGLQPSTACSCSGSYWYCSSGFCYLSSSLLSTTYSESMCQPEGCGYSGPEPAGSHIPLVSDSYHICGNYCGPGWCNGDWIDEADCDTSEPTDGSCVDECCRQHDQCCGSSDSSWCNQQLTSCAHECNSGPACRGGTHFFNDAMIIEVLFGSTYCTDQCCGHSCNDPHYQPPPPPPRLSPPPPTSLPSPPFSAQVCTCKASWQFPSDACPSWVAGCPTVACDGDTAGPWCIVDIPCQYDGVITSSTSAADSVWAYCDAPPPPLPSPPPPSPSPPPPSKLPPPPCPSPPPPQTSQPSPPSSFHSPAPTASHPTTYPTPPHPMGSFRSQFMVTIRKIVLAGSLFVATLFCCCGLRDHRQVVSYCKRSWAKCLPKSRAPVSPVTREIMMQPVAPLQTAEVLDQRSAVNAAPNAISSTRL